VLQQNSHGLGLYFWQPTTTGFAEDEFVGRTVRIGSKVSVWVLERDPRCAMITIDPDTAERNPGILGKVTKSHDGKAGAGEGDGGCAGGQTQHASTADERRH